MQYGFDASFSWDQSGHLYWQYVLLLYGKLRERAVCGKFCVLIGYPSGQDGAILPARDGPFHSHKVQASAWEFSFAEIIFCQGKKMFCVFSVFMEPEKASTRIKTKKTKMLISFKTTFCDKNRQTQKYVLNCNQSNDCIFCIYPIRM